MDLAPDGAVVGRDDVLAGLSELLAAARTGRGGVAVLSGDAGIGKTRLVTEIVGAAREAGVRVAVGQCDELDQSVPLAPVADLLGGLDMEAGSVEEGAPVRMAARAVEALAAADRPAVVVVEDLHWCDEASLSVLARVCRRAGSLPLLVVLTTRPVGNEPAVTGLLAGLERQAHAREWRLRPLGLDDTGRLVANLVGDGRKPARRFVERVHLITEGNPLFVTALVAALDVSGSGGELPDAEDLDRVPVPRSAQAAVWQRASRLTAGGRRLVQLAAVAGRAADVDLLAEVGGWDEQALLAHLGDAVGVGLLIEVSADRVAFDHELTRRAVLADVLARERRAVHLAFARAMERRHGADVTQAGALAYHFAAAEAWADAGEYAARAGRHALALGAPSAAVDLFTLAVDAAHRTGGVPATDVLAGRGAAYEVVGQFEPARLDFEEVLARAHQSGEGSPTAECSALLDLGRLWSGRDYGRAGDYYRRALELARRRGTPDVQADALNRTGSWHLNSERPEQARRHHQEALGLYRTAGDSRGEAATLDLLGTVHLTMGDLGAAAQSYGDAVVRFRAHDDRRALASALAMLTFCSRQYLAAPASWSDALTFDEAVAAGTESVELCRTMEWASGQALGHVALVSVLGQHGSYDAALADGAAAQRLAADAGNPYWSLLADLMVGAVHLDLLDTAVARDHLAAAFALASELGSDYWKRTVCSFLVDACLQAGDPAAARAAVDEVAGGPGGGSHPATMGVRHTLRARAEVAVATGDLAAAEAYASELAAAVEKHGPPAPLVQLLRGRVLAAAGSTAEAEAAWREGLAEAEGREVWPLAWRLNAALGRSLRARHNLDDADRHLLAARAQLDSLAAQMDDPVLRATFVAAATATLPTPTGRRATKHAYGGLTAREREVAVLVTDGLSNGQIADRLVVSSRTVEKHVEHVLTKLGLGSRAQIAAWAVRNGLEAEHT